MECAISSATSFSSSSQAKKLSPASPDHSVPSQSNAATRGSRRRIDSTKACERSVVVEVDTYFPGRKNFQIVIDVFQPRRTDAPSPVREAYSSGVLMLATTRGSSTV